MKKCISLFLSTLVIALLVPATTLATSGHTDVKGTISFDNAHVGKGIKVIVTCNGHIRRDSTDKTGAYFARFPKKQCMGKDVITVTTTVDGIKGESTGKAKKETCRLNVAIINVSVPEYGLIGLVGSAIIGGGAFVVIRRNQLGVHQT